MTVPAARYSLVPIQGLGAVAPSMLGPEARYFQTEADFKLTNPTILRPVDQRVFGNVSGWSGLPPTLNL